jgi:hypothetical protein
MPVRYSQYLLACNIKRGPYARLPLKFDGNALQLTGVDGLSTDLLGDASVTMNEVRIVILARFPREDGPDSNADLLERCIERRAAEK